MHELGIWCFKVSRVVKWLSGLKEVSMAILQGATTKGTVTLIHNQWNIYKPDTYQIWGLRRDKISIQQAKCCALKASKKANTKQPWGIGCQPRLTLEPVAGDQLCFDYRVRVHLVTFSIKAFYFCLNRLKLNGCTMISGLGLQQVGLQVVHQH